MTRGGLHQGAGHEWSFAEDAICFEEYQKGVGWEGRAAARLEGRSAHACEERSTLLHLRPSRWIKDEMKRMGMTVAEEQ